MFISSVKCKKCSHVSNSYDPFLDLSLEIRRRNHSVQDCLDSFFAKEKLDDKYLCEKCNKKSYATKRIFIYRLPKYLTIHLKRFRFRGEESVKIEKNISYPMILDDLDRYVVGDLKQNFSYELFAIVVHYGEFDGGHYIAWAKR